MCSGQHVTEFTTSALSVVGSEDMLISTVCGYLQKNVHVYQCAMGACCL